jgi:hypothetical protein
MLVPVLLKLRAAILKSRLHFRWPEPLNVRVRISESKLALTLQKIS